MRIPLKKQTCLVCKPHQCDVILTVSFCTGQKLVEVDWSPVFRAQWFHWIQWFHLINVEWRKLSISVFWLFRVVCTFGRLHAMCITFVCTCTLHVCYRPYLYVWFDCESPCEMKASSKVHLYRCGRTPKGRYLALFTSIQVWRQMFRLFNKMDLICLHPVVANQCYNRLTA